MTTGYIFIASILILGGAVATIGDRVSTQIRTQRLSVFNLSPRNAALVVTIFTGLAISASTLAMLFAIDDGLRKGVFELEQIQKDLKQKREQQETTSEQP
ncbi:MAG: DUF3084 domain-containing protein [Iphinoe sp. HA4291-MV1]|nr:DUF3084 domain-containing protein [Iphinoe sp. HA4291-MV1]